jgi:hypothetical protein
MKALSLLTFSVLFFTQLSASADDDKFRGKTYDIFKRDTRAVKSEFVHEYPLSDCEKYAKDPAACRDAHKVLQKHLPLEKISFEPSVDKRAWKTVNPQKQIPTATLIRTLEARCNISTRSKQAIPNDCWDLTAQFKDKLAVCTALREKYPEELKKNQKVARDCEKVEKAELTNIRRDLIDIKAELSSYAIRPKGEFESAKTIDWNEFALKDCTFSKADNSKPLCPVISFKPQKAAAPARDLIEITPENAATGAHFTY